MMPAKTKKTAVPATFSDYKLLKDDILEISEQRFENFINKKFEDFRKDFKADLMGEINVRFDAQNDKFDAKIEKLESKFDARFNAIDSKFEDRFNSIDSKFAAIDGKFAGIEGKFAGIDAKFESIEKRLTLLTWMIPVFFTIIMLAFRFFDKH